MSKATYVMCLVWPTAWRPAEKRKPPFPDQWYSLLAKSMAVTLAVAGFLLGPSKARSLDSPPGASTTTSWPACTEYESSIAVGGGTMVIDDSYSVHAGHEL